MTAQRAAPALTGAVELLERAISYTLGSLPLVTPQAMANGTPCRGWDLRALLVHVEISVADLELTSDVVAATGAVEVAVHGWDVSRACRQDRPVPPALAGDLLELCLLLVGAADRPTRFAAPVPVPPRASPSDRLVAFLGRQPWWVSRGPPTSPL